MKGCAPGTLVHGLICQFVGFAIVASQDVLDIEPVEFGNQLACPRMQVAQLDHSFEWEKTYDYRATVVTLIAGENGTGQQVEGEDTPLVRVLAHDVFPPAVPAGVQAVFSGPGQKPFIDLVWTPNPEPDLAGYNVYRRDESGGEAVKLNSDLIKSPAFRDNEVAPSHKYVYSVSAVDVRGNESRRSEEATESVPSQ